MSLPGFAFVTPFILWQGEERGVFSHMSLPGLALVTPLIFAQGEKGGGFNMCLYLALPLSLHSSYGKVRSGAVLTYVSTWPCPCHSTNLCAR